jgi:hypothetical protein
MAEHKTPLLSCPSSAMTENQESKSDGPASIAGTGMVPVKKFELRSSRAEPLNGGEKLKEANGDQALNLTGDNDGPKNNGKTEKCEKNASIIASESGSAPRKVNESLIDRVASSGGAEERANTPVLIPRANGNGISPERQKERLEEERRHNDRFRQSSQGTEQPTKEPSAHRKGEEWVPKRGDEGAAGKEAREIECGESSKGDESGESELGQTDEAESELSGLDNAEESDFGQSDESDVSDSESQDEGSDDNGAQEKANGDTDDNIPPGWEERRAEGITLNHNIELHRGELFPDPCQTEVTRASKRINT